MSFGNAFDDEDNEMSDINMTPLVDVMLVLLIIFMLTVPVLTHSVGIDLPQATSEPSPSDQPSITVAIKADGSLYWGEEPVSSDGLKGRLAGFAAKAKNGSLQFRADRAVRYEHVAQVMAMAQQAGVEQLGIVTLPVR